MDSHKNRSPQFLAEFDQPFEERINKKTGIMTGFSDQFHIPS